MRSQTLKLLSQRLALPICVCLLTKYDVICSLSSIDVEDASELFFNSLREVYEPEQKRKLIGQMFLDVKDKAATKLGCQSAEWVLGQVNTFLDTLSSMCLAISHLIIGHYLP